MVIQRVQEHYTYSDVPIKSIVRLAFEAEKIPNVQYIV